ncbi:LrgB family protein [Gelidibacter salicanalis]|uniref:LrgB family protein n=1 Tax=Gelidibacter salicanalis TaxID=291193 RepID=A0A5C7AME0_9FLAO|nr:LrgB family protein [Gelidibacter salicanalis]TXE09104.1 LrgB family protein [Gelidibacter salicanalis]
MIELYKFSIFGIVLTLIAFFGALALREKLKFVLFNPVLIASAAIILVLVLSDISFADYNKGGKYLSFFLSPAIVALGVLFFEKYKVIKHNMYPFIMAVCSGGIISILCVSILTIIMNAPEVIIKSIVPLSVTTPIAIEITKMTYGIPSITAGVVIAVGIFGNAIGPGFLKFVGIKSKTAIGTALGTAAHGIGTARAIEIGPLPGAYSGLAMCVNGVLTTLMAPHVVVWIISYVSSS